MEKTETSHISNLEWFIANQQRLVHLYNGMYIVIRDEAVIGNFNDEMEAIHWMRSKFYDEGCSCYHCIPGTQAYTITL